MLGDAETEGAVVELFPEVAADGSSAGDTDDLEATAFARADKMSVADSSRTSTDKAAGTGASCSGEADPP